MRTIRGSSYFKTRLKNSPQIINNSRIYIKLRKKKALKHALDQTVRL